MTNPNLAAVIVCDPPEDCRGHFDSCEHVEGYIACDACIAERTKNGPRYCWLPEQGESESPCLFATAPTTTNAGTTRKERPMPETNDDALLAQIADRRTDEAFMARLRQRMAEDAPLLLRLREGECRSARLVESRDGGATLVYECECGARLTRTRSQAETDATKQASDSSVASDPGSTDATT